MQRPRLMLLLACALAGFGQCALTAGAPPPAVQQAEVQAGDQWPQWRGPLSTGVAPTANPPVEWNEESHVRWKAPLPGRGHASPIVWNDRVFIVTAIPVGPELPPQHTVARGAHDNIPVTRRQQFVLLAIDRQSGQEAFRVVLREALPHDGGGHYTASLASQSPVTDGRRVYVNLGSQGVHCVDFAGNIVWSRDLGKMYPVHGHGEGSSPALFGQTLLVNWDHERDSFLVAFDIATGEERWRVPRDEVTSWASPLIVTQEGRQQVVVSGTQRVRAYRIENGELLWECGGLSSNIVATPVAADGMLFAGSSYDTKAMLAIRLEGARGDLTGGQQIAWSRHRATPYVPSPLLLGETLYFLNHYQGVLIGVDARTGTDRPGAMRLPGITDVYASPIAAAGRIYITDREGTTVVYQQAERPRFLAENRLDDRFSASGAISGRDLFLRGEKFLYCLQGD